MWAVAVAMGCKPAPEAPPQHVVTVSAGPDFTVIGASFVNAAQVAWREGPCFAVSLRGVDALPSDDGGRVEAWVVAGPVLGHADRGADGVYRATVRARLPEGTRLAAEIAGGGAVARHRWRTPATVPTAVTRRAPGEGFVLRPSAGLALAWSGGTSSHVAVSVTVARPSVGSAPEPTWEVTCVVPRAPGQFTIPAGAFARFRQWPAMVPEAVTVAVVACDRAQEGAYALDAMPVARPEDLVRGALQP